jgi:hypothetical protein
MKASLSPPIFSFYLSLHLFVSFLALQSPILPSIHMLFMAQRWTDWHDTDSNHQTIVRQTDTNGAHTNTIESTWKHVKVLLSPYNRKADYVYILAEYMFRQRCKAEDVEPFCKLIEIVATAAWSITDPTDVQWRFFRMCSKLLKMNGTSDGNNLILYYACECWRNSLCRFAVSGIVRVRV